MKLTDKALAAIKENEDIIYEEINSDDCCDNPYIVMESGCETCKACGFSACVIA